MKVNKVRRVFQYKNKNLPDPNPNLTPEQIRGIIAATYPEVTSAVIQGPTFKGDEERYEFVAHVGTKG